MASKYPENLYEKDSDESSGEEKVYSGDSSDYEAFLKETMRANDVGVTELLTKVKDDKRRRGAIRRRREQEQTDEDDAPSLLETELLFLKKVHLADQQVRDVVRVENQVQPITPRDVQQQRVRLILLTMVQDLLSAVPREQPGADLSELIEKLRVNTSVLEIANNEGLKMGAQPPSQETTQQTLVDKFKKFVTKK